jgi:hypothetical protein
MDCQLEQGPAADDLYKTLKFCFIELLASVAQMVVHSHCTLKVAGSKPTPEISFEKVGISVSRKVRHDKPIFQCIKSSMGSILQRFSNNNFYSLL